jgi:hypothetical protein
LVDPSPWAHRFCSKEISPVNSMTAKDNSWVLVTGASSGFGGEFAGNTQHKVGRWSLWYGG